MLHHHGFLSNLERISAPNLRMEKEINDVFEYLLLQSGRLIIQTSDDRRAIVLDNVPFIRRKEEAVTRMLRRVAGAGPSGRRQVAYAKLRARRVRVVIDRDLRDPAVFEHFHRAAANVLLDRPAGDDAVCHCDTWADFVPLQDA